MATDFWIQASCPRWTTIASPDDESLADAIDTIFPSNTERAILAWRHVHIPLGYKYCISFLIDDVLTMVDQLTSSVGGQWKVVWPSNEFAAVWQLEWSGESLRVMTEWKQVVGGTEELLQRRSVLEIDRQAFLCEWTKLFTTLRDALAAAGYTEKALPGLIRLNQAIATIAEVGDLYR
jgi:hypothetical protein